MTICAGLADWEIFVLLTRIPQMNCQFDDVQARFCYKNQCNTIITMGQSLVTRRVNPESPIYGSISTVDLGLNSMVPR